jgi:hypothetical protein
VKDFGKRINGFPHRYPVGGLRRSVLPAPSAPCPVDDVPVGARWAGSATLQTVKGPVQGRASRISLQALASRTSIRAFPTPGSARSRLRSGSNVGTDHCRAIESTGLPDNTGCRRAASGRCATRSRDQGPLGVGLLYTWGNDAIAPQARPRQYIIEIQSFNMFADALA